MSGRVNGTNLLHRQGTCTSERDARAERILLIKADHESTSMAVVSLPAGPVSTKLREVTRNAGGTRTDHLKDDSRLGRCPHPPLQALCALPIRRGVRTCRNPAAGYRLSGQLRHVPLQKHAESVRLPAIQGPVDQGLDDTGTSDLLPRPDSLVVLSGPVRNVEPSILNCSRWCGMELSPRRSGRKGGDGTVSKTCPRETCPREGMRRH